MDIDLDYFLDVIKESARTERERCIAIVRRHRDDAIGQGHDGYAVAEAIEREIYNNKGAALLLR